MKWTTITWGALWIAWLAIGANGCTGAERSVATSDADTDTDMDADTDADTDTDSDTDTDTGTDTGSDTDTGTDPLVEFSYIWIANTGEGTVSKVDTVSATEVGRYVTGPDDYNDPSRTSVNLHGDMVVTNRDPMTAPSSVTKFIANIDECYDKNDNDVIDTSTGGSDVKLWGEDECMMWRTELGGSSSGARATAWDGQEDPETGLGGHVWIGTCSWISYDQKVYKLDGEWGDIEEEIWAPVGCAYGGAMDGNGGFWIYDSNQALARVDTETLEVTTHSISCGYGISVDSQGRVWTGGWGNYVNSCVSRYDPLTDTEDVVEVAGAEFLRGIAVGLEMSAGSVWAADTSGRLYQVDQETMEVVNNWNVGAYDMIGVAIDFQGYVWTVSQMGNAAYKFNPETETQETVSIGLSPYTYSDMTGAQLANVIPVE
jgi:hypothetical protein